MLVPPPEINANSSNLSQVFPCAQLCPDSNLCFSISSQETGLHLFDQTFRALCVSVLNWNLKWFDSQTVSVEAAYFTCVCLGVWVLLCRKPYRQPAIIIHINTSQNDFSLNVLILTDRRTKSCRIICNRKFDCKWRKIGGKIIGLLPDDYICSRATRVPKAAWTITTWSACFLLNLTCMMCVFFLLRKPEFLDIHFQIHMTEIIVPL